MARIAVIAGVALVIIALLAAAQFYLLANSGGATSLEQVASVDVVKAFGGKHFRGDAGKPTRPLKGKPRTARPAAPTSACDSWDCTVDKNSPPGSEPASEGSSEDGPVGGMPGVDLMASTQEKEEDVAQPKRKAKQRKPTEKSKAGGQVVRGPPTSVYQKADSGVSSGLSRSQRHAAKDYFCENRARGKAELKAVDGSSMTSYIASGGRFPLLMVTKDRHEQLKKTISSLLSVRCVDKEDIYVVQDGENSLVTVVLDAANVKRNVKTGQDSVVGDGASKIAQHYRYALQKGFDVHPTAPALIVVEDDFAFSPDYYEYFHAVAPVIESDPTLWLASAWHDNGFDYLVADPYGLRRTAYFPGLGWLLPRKLWERELASKWPNTHWDHWMRDPIQHQGRDIIVPEIPRDYHMGIKGTFMDSGTHNRYFGSIAMQADPSFTWDTPTGAAAIEDLSIERYDARLRAVIAEPDTVHLASVSALGSFRDGTGIVWYSVPPGENNHDHMRAVAGYFGIWHEGGRASRNGVHELWWLGSARLILINVYRGPEIGGPHVTGSIEVSSFRSIMPTGQRVLDWSEFIGAERPQLPVHSNLFGAKISSPLAHVDGGSDANGVPDVSVGGRQDGEEDAGAGTVVVYTRVASGHEEEEEAKDGSHDHSRFMGDLRLSRGAVAPAVGARGGLAAGQQGMNREARIGVLPESVHIVASRKAGLHCDAVCSAYTVGAAAAGAAAGGGSAEVAEAEAGAGSWKCALSYFPVINDCATLRSNFDCAKCSDSMGPDQPAMIAASAPIDKLPGACLVNSDPSMHSCTGRWTYALRLCPCELIPE